MASPLFNLVLLNPEIPNNTGNIGRTAAATGCRLHIVHPIAFDMSEKARRRAGLDYWHLVDCVEHDSWEAFLEREGFDLPSPAGCGGGGVGAHEQCAPSGSTLTLPSPTGRGEKRANLWLYTTRSSHPHWEVRFTRGDYMLFGRETAGVPESIHQWVADRYGDNHRITLPMVEDPAARSLNLATAVCAAVYEGMRQVGLRSSHCAPE